MKKQTIYIITGVVIVGGIGWYLFRPKPPLNIDILGGIGELTSSLNGKTIRISDMPEAGLNIGALVMNNTDNEMTVQTGTLLNGPSGSVSMAVHKMSPLPVLSSHNGGWIAIGVLRTNLSLGEYVLTVEAESADYYMSKEAKFTVV